MEESEAVRWWDLGIALGGVVLTAVIGWVGKVSGKVHKTELAIESLTAGLDPKLGEALRLEIDQVHSRVTDVATKLAAARGEMSGIQSQLKLIHEHLLGTIK